MTEALNVTLVQNTYDSNASASVFGWEFQTNAAIFLAFQYIKDFTEIKIEGQIDDVEIYFKEMDPIFIQVKSQENPEPSSNTLKHFKNGIKTLINASEKSLHSELIYLSNINNPLSNKSVAMYFNSLSQYSYNELPLVVKTLIDKQIQAVVSKESLSRPNFQTDKLSNITIPYFGNHLPTRYRCITEKINNFLSKLDMNTYIGEDLLCYLQKQFFTNATTKNVKLKKEDIVWPIVVLGSLKLSETRLDEFDDGFADEIKSKYHEYINKQSHKFGLITKVMNEFYNYRKNEGHIKRSTKVLLEQFINDSWLKFTEEINCENKEIEECLVKTIIELIIIDRFKIEKLKGATNL
ncbi:MAG: hypothetical protein ABS939_03070 [Psychrobacillus sp.]